MAPLIHDKPFDAYCQEEQAELVGYYASVFLRPLSREDQLKLFTPIVLTETCLIITAKHLDLLQNTVERKLPHLAAARLYNDQLSSRYLDCMSAGEPTAACQAKHYVNMAGQPFVLDRADLPFTVPKKQVVSTPAGA